VVVEQVLREEMVHPQMFLELEEQVLHQLLQHPPLPEQGVAVVVMIMEILLVLEAQVVEVQEV
jgi:hypothetical protein